MLMLKILGMLLLLTTIGASPIASVHLKFVSPPHSYEHGYTTDGDTTIIQKSFLSIGRRRTKNVGERLQAIGSQQNYPEAEQHPRNIRLKNVESLWPDGVFIPPIDVNDLGYSSFETRHMTPDFSDGTQYSDPYLLTGETAKYVVKYIYGRGELFLTDYPHVRALLRNQEERRRNGLPGLIFKSLRPESPFHAKANLN